MKKTQKNCLILFNKHKLENTCFLISFLICLLPLVAFSQNITDKIALANNYISQQNFEKVLSISEEITKENPDDFRGFYYLGFALLKMNNLKDAEVYANKSLELAPADRKLEVEKLLKAINLSNSVESNLTKANQAYTSNKYALAAQLYENVWLAKKEDYEVLKKCIDIYLFNLKDYLKAEGLIQKGLKEYHDAKTISDLKNYSLQNKYNVEQAYKQTLEDLDKSYDPFTENCCDSFFYHSLLDKLTLLEDVNLNTEPTLIKMRLFSIMQDEESFYFTLTNYLQNGNTNLEEILPKTIVIETTDVFNKPFFYPTQSLIFFNQYFFQKKFYDLVHDKFGNEVDYRLQAFANYFKKIKERINGTYKIDSVKSYDLTLNDEAIELSSSSGKLEIDINTINQPKIISNLSFNINKYKLKKRGKNLIKEYSVVIEAIDYSKNIYENFFCNLFNWKILGFGEDKYRVNLDGNLKYFTEVYKIDYDFEKEGSYIGFHKEENKNNSLISDGIIRYIKLRKDN